MYYCKYCNKEFKYKKNLNKHQTTVKYCLKIQNKQEFICLSCNKKLSNMQNLKRHEKNCKEYILENNLKNLKLKKYKKRIRKLENQIEKMTTQIINRPTIIANNSIGNNNSKNTNTNTVNNNILIQQLEPLTDAYLKEQAKFLTVDHIRKGAAGYAEYAMNYPLKNRILCTDTSRKKFKHKDENSNIITDYGGTIFSQKVFTAFKDENYELIDKELENVNDIIKRTGNSSKYLLDQIYNLTVLACYSAGYRRPS